MLPHAYSVWCRSLRRDQLGRELVASCQGNARCLENTTNERIVSGLIQICGIFVSNNTIAHVEIILASVIRYNQKALYNAGYCLLYISGLY